MQKSGEMTLLHVHTTCLFHPQQGSARSRCAAAQLQAEGIREQPQKQAGRCHSSSASVRGSTENLRVYDPTSFSQHSYSRLISEAWNLTQRVGSTQWTQRAAQKEEGVALLAWLQQKSHWTQVSSTSSHGISSCQRILSRPAQSPKSIVEEKKKKNLFMHTQA